MSRHAYGMCRPDKVCAAQSAGHSWGRTVAEHACRATAGVLDKEGILEEEVRKRECASLRLQLASAAKLVAQGIGEESAAAVRLAVARDEVTRLATAVSTQ